MGIARGFMQHLMLIRPLNCLMAAFATAVGYWISVSAFGYGHGLLAAACAAFAVCAGGQAINDYFDAETDRRIRPGKPIPSGAVGRDTAVQLAIILFACGNALALTVSDTAFYIAFGFTLLLVAYSSLLRRFKYIGNWVVAAGMAFTLIFGASVSGNYSVVAFLAAAALFAGVPREIIKDLEDLEADVEKVSLPMVVGELAGVAAVAVLYALAVCIAAYVFVAGIFGGMAYAVLVAVAAVVFLYSTLLAAKRMPKAAQRCSKLGMMVALLAFLAGIF